MPNADDMLDLPVDDAQVDRMACTGLPTLPPGLLALPHTQQQQQQQRQRQATTTLEPLAACTSQPDDDASAVAPRRAPFTNPRPLMHSPLERLDHSDESDSEDSSLTTDVLMFSPSPTMADAHRERNADTSSDADDNVPQPLTNTSNLSTPPQPATAAASGAAASALLSPASSMVSVLSPGVTPGQGSKAVLTRSFAETVKLKL